MARPKGVKNSNGYNLSPQGYVRKRQTMVLLLARLHKEGRIGSGHFKTHAYPESARQKNRESTLRLIAEGRLNPGDNIRRFIADGASEKYLKSRVNHGTHGMFYSRKNGRSMSYDSSWELQRFRFLERSKQVVFYAHNLIRIAYKFEGRRHYYWPDILVEYSNGKVVVEEIKPKWSAKAPQQQAKIRAARKRCRQLGWSFHLIGDCSNLIK